MHGQLTAHRINPEEAYATDGVARLDQVFARLDRAITSEQVASAIVDGGRLATGASSGALVLLTPDRRELRIVYADGDGQAPVGQQESLRVSAHFPLCDVVRTRQELWITDRSELAERYPNTTPCDKTQAWAAIPLQIDGVVLGSVGWSFQSPWLSWYQRSCLRSLAEAGGVALYRAGVFDSERTTRLRAELGSYDVVLQDRIMAEVSVALDSAGDTGDTAKTLERIAYCTFQRLGEWCCVQLLDDHGRLHDVMTVHRDPGKNRLLHERSGASARYPSKLLPPLKSGNFILIRTLDTDASGGAGPTPRQTQALRKVGLDRLLIMPLRIHGRTLGSMSFGTGHSDVAYSAADVALAERVTRRCAAWLEYGYFHRLAQRADQAREDFVAATSHELRTPLSHIKGFVSTLRSNETIWDATTRDDFLAEIEHEADRLASLVETLLDLSHIDASGLDPTQRRSVAAAAVIAAGIDRVRLSLGDRYLDVQAPADLPPIWADPSHVERVIANLLDNAAKYSPPDQPIRLAARTSGKFVVFLVEDRGLGIPAAHRERIFQPFFREANGAYPAKPGTGLGLAICRSIIRAHRGRIWAEQRPEGGTVMAFTLPIATASQRK
jgi:signal transduction histidine kinase